MISQQTINDVEKLMGRLDFRIRNAVLFVGNRIPAYRQNQALTNS